MKISSIQSNGKMFANQIVLGITALLAVTGCTNTKMVVPKKLEFERSTQTANVSLLGDQQLKRKYSESDTPKLPALNSGNADKNKTQPVGGTADEHSDLTVSFDQMPLPTFIQAVYGSVLKTNYSMDGAVAARTDLVTFHTPRPQTASQMANLARMLLKSYGIAVQDFGGVIRMVPDTATSSYSPAIRRGRAQPDTPQSLRPVFYYVELESVRVMDFNNLLKTMFGTKIQIQDDLARNAVLLSGQADDISAVMEVIQVFDQPLMRGQRTKRISPVFWTADEFSKRLVEVLSAEGYAASTSLTSGAPILILPIAPLNSVIVFASSEKVLNHAIAWARDLDKPSNSQAGGSFFTYPVKYADAQALAKTLSDLIGGGTSAPAMSAPIPGQSTAAQVAPASKAGSKIVVNNATNSLIIQGGGPDEYRNWMALLAELDKPTKSALIDLVVAEVTAGTIDSLGVDWNYKSDTTGSGGTINSASAGGKAGGILFSYLSPNKLTSANFAALATKSGGEILSSPKLMARNGETAMIQVADEVPILAQTTTTPTTSSGPSTTNTIQYRTAGMVLKVRPVINSGSRIDLDVSQEVSSVKSVLSGGIASPTISIRKVDTKLTLRDGATVMLAGLISNKNTTSDSGVPLLKDIPGLGNLFKLDTRDNNKTELIILITPYIINDDFEAEAVTNVFRDSLGEWAKDLKDSTGLKASKRSSVREVANPERKQAPEDKSITADTAVLPGEEKSDATAVPSEQKPQTELSGEPITPAKDVPGNEATDSAKKASDDTADVIMSKPEAAPAPATPVANKPADKKGSKVDAGSRVKPTPPPPPGTKPVENQDLLDELRKAVEKR